MIRLRRSRVGLGVLALFMTLACMMLVVPSSAFAISGDGHEQGSDVVDPTQGAKAVWGAGNASYNDFMDSMNKKKNPKGYGSVFSSWKPSGSLEKTGYARLKSALIKACNTYKKNGGKNCSNTQVATVGAIVFSGGAWAGRPVEQIIGNIFDSTNNRIEDQLKNTKWKMFDTEMTIWKTIKWNGKKSNLQTIAKSNYGNKVAFIIIIVDQAQVNPQGWYPTWGVSRRADLASANTLATEELQPCAAYWYVTATGIDGHVKGKTTKTTQYITPYGKLWNAVQTGGTWTSATGRKYGPFKGDWQNQDSISNQAREARNVACDETNKMKITYDYGNDVPNGTPTADAVTITSKDDFLKSYAKGGIYKITKKVRNATITVKKTDLKVYERASMRVDFRGWRQCNAGSKVSTISQADINALKKYVPKTSGAFDLNQLVNWNGKKCGYIGKSNPAGKGGTNEIIQSIKNAYKGTSIPGHLNTGANGTVGLWYGNFGKNDGWVLSKNQGRALAEAKNFGAKGSDNNITLNDGKRVTISKVFNRGYPTKWNCKGKIYTTEQMERDDLPTANCVVESDGGFQFQNEVLGEWRNYGHGPQWVWLSGGKTAFLQGSALKSDGAIKSYNAAVKPVSNRLQSIYTVAYQDFVNINCNRQDFEAFVNKVNAQQASMGIAPDKRLTIQSSTKFNGVARTGVITTADVPTLAEIVPRVLGSTMANGRTINGLSIKDVTGKDNPTIDGQSWTQYRRTNGKYNVGYNADKDPVYSKECPFDCTTETRASRVNASNVGRTNASGPDLATGAYGVRVNAKTGNGASAPESNTANMQFFRNNEWNLFKVDLYSPVAGSNNAGQVSYDGSAAKSTVITRNTDGTPWFSPKGQLLTNMEGKRNGSYRPIFTADYPYYQANKDSETAPIQLQSTSASTEGLGSRIASVQWPGQVNEFRIRSVWATENGTPLKFRFKWEYDATAHVTVPDKISFIGNGDPAGATTEVDYKTVSAKVDGKCLSQQNTLNPSPNTTKLNHDSSGSGTPNVDDRRFDSPDYGLGARGWISVTFVRATAE